MGNTDDKVDRVVRENNHIWKTKSAYWTFVRGGIRRGLWMRNPVKIAFKTKQRKLIPNPKGKGRAFVYGNQCAICKEWYPQNEVEVDHISGHHALNCEDDLINYFTSIALVCENELQLVCKPCHKIKSYAERMNISFNEAKVIKQVIELQKTGKDKEELLKLGFTNGNIPTTKDKRRVALEKLLLEQLK